MLGCSIMAVSILHIQSQMHMEYVSMSLPLLLPSSLDSSAVSVYTENLSQWHSQFTPWGECLCVIQQPPRRVSALTAGTHHPLRRLGYFSRRSETFIASWNSLKLFSIRLFCLQTPSGSNNLLVHAMHPAVTVWWQLLLLQDKLLTAEVSNLALEPAQTHAPVISLFSVRVSLLLLCLVWLHRAQ